MLTINATLAAAQTKLPQIPVVKATLEDTPVLRPQVLHSSIGNGTDFDGVLVSDAILQVRCQTPIAYYLQSQRITTPGTAGQWTTWANVDTAACIACTVFTTGTYAVVVYWVNAGATMDLKWRRSSDGGATWSAAQTLLAGVATATAVGMAIAGVSGGASSSGVFYYDVAHLKIVWRGYTPASDTWAAAASSSFTLGATENLLGLAGSWDSTNSKYLCFYSYQDTTGGNNKLLLFTYTPASTWSTPDPIFSIATRTSYFSRVSLSQDQIDGRWWLTMMRWNASTTRLVYLLCAVYLDGGQYRVSGAIEYERDTADAGRVKVYPSAAFTGGVILASLRQARRSPETQTYFTDRTVVSYRWEAGGRVRCVLDNRDGAITEPLFLASLTLERGLKIGGTDYLVSLPTFYVSSFAFIEYDGMVELTGVDALGLLAIWTATESESWSSKTIKELIRLVCGRAKVFDLTFDASTDWNATITSFTLHNGRSAAYGLQALLGMVGKGRVVARGAGLHCFVLGDVTQHTYTRQNYWKGRFGRALLSNYAMVAGSSDSAVGDYAGDEGDTGFRVGDIILDSQVVTVAGAETLAESVIAYSQETAQGSGEILAPPNFALEVGDVVAISDVSLWAADLDWRVVGFAEEYRTGEQPFGQVIALRAE